MRIKQKQNLREYANQLATMTPEQLQNHLKALKSDVSIKEEPQTKTIATITRFGERFVVSSPYNPKFVEAMKTIPASQRQFNPTTKEWTFPNFYLGQLRDLCKRHFTELHEVESEAPAKEDTLYGVLRVARNATDAEIKKAHRRLVMQYHPDKGGDRRFFERIQKAYEILSDPKKRKRYDAALTLTTK